MTKHSLPVAICSLSLVGCIGFQLKTGTTGTTGTIGRAGATGRTGANAPAAGDQPRNDAEVEARALTGLAPDDSLDLAKLQAAIQAGGAAHLVYTQSHDGRELEYKPYNIKDSAPERCTLGREPSEPTKLARYRAMVEAYDVNGDGIVSPRKSLHVDCAGNRAEPKINGLAPGTPGVIWSVVKPATQWETARVLFVTLDGGRYLTWTGSLGATPPAGAAAPPPVLDTFLLPDEIAALVKVGGLAASFQDAIERASSAWTSCQEATWKPFDARWEANKVADLSESTRTNRRVQIVEEWTKITRVRCAHHVDAYEQALLAAIEARAEARRGLLQSP